MDISQGGIKLWSNTKNANQSGFTLIEVLIVVVIIGILAAIAIPSYDRYVKDTKRTDMMVQLQQMANKIESQRLVDGGYNAIKLEKLQVEQMSPIKSDPSIDFDYPAGNPLYEIVITPKRVDAGTKYLDGSNWTLTATPINTAVMQGDGNLTLDSTGEKCHSSTCSNGDDWQ